MFEWDDQPFLRCSERDVVIDSNLQPICHGIGAHCPKLFAYSAFEGAIINANLEVVITSSREDFEIRLIDLESDSISDPCPKHER